jgi:palmitoyl-protein thioesterase
MLYQSILALASAIVGTLARPTQDVLSLSKPRPLVIWHGLGESLPLRNGAGGLTPSRSPGDSYASSGMEQFQSLIAKIHPGIFIHSVYIDPDAKEDQRATFVRPNLTSPSPPTHTVSLKQYGNVDDQVEQVAGQLKAVSELSGGFDAIGFSQGS